MRIIEAGDNESEEVAELVKELLVELEPGNAAAIDNMQLAKIAKSLLSSGKCGLS